MEEDYQKKYLKIVAEVVAIEGGGVCDFGHKVGDRFVFDEYGPDKKMCLYAQAALMPAISAMLHGGDFPWRDKGEEIHWGCPHPGTMYKGLG